MPNGLPSRALNPLFAAVGGAGRASPLSGGRYRGCVTRCGANLRTKRASGDSPANEGGTAVPRPLRMWGFLSCRGTPKGKEVVAWAMAGGGVKWRRIHKTGVVCMPNDHPEVCPVFAYHQAFALAGVRDTSATGGRHPARRHRPLQEDCKGNDAGSAGRHGDRLCA